MKKSFKNDNFDQYSYELYCEGKDNFYDLKDHDKKILSTLHIKNKTAEEVFEWFINAIEPAIFFDIWKKIQEGKATSALLFNEIDKSINQYFCNDVENYFENWMTHVSYLIDPAISVTRKYN